MASKIQKYKASKQILFLAVIVLPVFFMISVYACSFAKSNETKPTVYQLNEERFQEGNDNRNAAFIVASAEIYLREIRLGQLAQIRAHQIDVRELGKINEAYNKEKMVALMKLAKAKSVSIPTSLNETNERIFALLANQSVNSFDKSYCDMMVKNHKKSMHFFETVAAETTDEDIKKWATDALSGMNKQLSYAVVCRKNCITRTAF
ncbi:MAG: DUF4142 domain-containing protein [Cytophaga sp.]|uniref:DUF4142 domain-containing protein n=1 Tax=Cytophaga sp. TaxID=29535 RepID=UPI003F81559E